MIILLCGGDKKTQRRDIVRAKALAKELEIWKSKMIKTEPFDAARYITAPEDQQDVLDDAFASGSASYIASALGVIARAA